MLVSENQQATASWITGILEGEGHFEQYKRSITYRVSITNTNPCIIRAVQEFLTKNYVLHSISHKAKKTRGGKTIYVIYVSGVDCRNLYTILEPYLECRRDQYQKLVGASETIRDGSIDLQWLIGIWQAEGTFCLLQSGKSNIKPNISLVNTNEKIINKVVANLHAVGCAWYVQESHTETNKPYQRIVISGMKRCDRFLSTTNGLWIGKRDIRRTSLLREYVKSRLAHEQREPYTPREMNIYHELKELND